MAYLEKGMEPVLRELASSGSILRNLLEAAPVGVAILKNRVLHWVNDQMVEITGYSRTDLVNSDARMLYADDAEYARVGRVFYSAGEDRTRWIRADGRTIHVMIRSIQLDPADESAGYAMAALDVSELVESRHDLEAGNRQLETLNRQLAARKEELKATTQELENRVKDLEEYNTRLIQAQDALKRHIEFEEMIIEISTRFINLPVERLDEEIKRALKLLGKFTGVDRCYVFQYTDDTNIIDNTHEWVRKGVRPEKEHLQGLDISDFQSVTEAIPKGEVVNIPRVSNLAPGPDKDEFNREGIKSLVCVPMNAGAIRIGFLGFDSVRAEKEWSDRAVNLLKIAAEIFANAIERRQRERKLRMEKDRARNYFDIAGVIMVALNHEGKVTMINGRGTRILGWSESEIIGKNWFENFLPRKSRPEVRRVMENLMADRIENVEYHENPIVTRDGQERLIAWRNTLLRDDESRVIGTLSSGEDITEARRAEEELRIKNEELEAALAVKTDFLSIVSHELRTPLVPILGYSELLLTGAMGELPSRFLKALQTIKNRAVTLSAIIEDLLTLSRIERSAINIAPEPVSIRERLELIVNDYMSMNHDKKVELLLSGKDCRVMVDPSRLAQIIQNLIDNAIKYSGPTVTIRIRIEKKKNRCLIHVSDNGIGIPEEHLSDIFDKFYQVEPADTRCHGGAGLGLAIVKDLVEIMGGEIRVLSKPGHGTTFTVSLKSAVQDSVARKPAVEDVTKRSRGMNAPENTILVIDDDPFTLDITRSFLEKDYNVIAAETGARGLDIAHRTKVDLILLDGMMPDMDGISVLDSLKVDELTGLIPVVFISGKVEPNYIEAAISAGAAGFVKKPFTRDQLLEWMERILHH